MQEGSLFIGNNFPNTCTDIPVICDKMVQHAVSSDDRSATTKTPAKPTSAPDPRGFTPPAGSKTPAAYNDLWPVMKKELLWTEARDVWYVHLDPLWADFHGTPVTGTRPVPFVDAFPVCLWLYKQDENLVQAKMPPKLPQRQHKPDGKRAKKKSVEQPQGPILDHAKMHLLVHISNLVSVQLNHFQFLFLMRLLETVSEITTFLTQDVSHILGEADESSMALGLIAPQVDLSLLMPSISQSKDSIGGDFNHEGNTEATNTSVYSLGKEKAIVTWYVHNNWFSACARAKILPITVILCLSASCFSEHPFLPTNNT